ncbi:MAG TPA: dipeptidase [Anaerolineae bacterium]|nr:dipeptidase [Anaerolineae bacterium]HXV99993.1 dipeptidase [Anaerolineae bacterium]
MSIPPIVDLHGDILYDVTHRRTFKGEQRILETHHLESLRQGGVKIQVLPIYFDSINLPEAALRQTVLIANAFLEEMDEAGDYFTVIKTKSDLAAAMQSDKIGVMLAMEGAEGLGRDVGMIRLFYELGLRMIGLTWNRANTLAEGSGEDTGAGLTVLGRQLVANLANYPIILDVSHLNEAGFWSALENGQGPVLASHSNSAAVCPHHRNLTDDQIKALAERGGLIGLNFYPEFVTPTGVDLIPGLLRHVDHIANLVGLEHLALGPDFTNYLPEMEMSAQELATLKVNPATVGPMPDVTILPHFYQALREHGFSADEATLIMGGNAQRFLQEALPD